MSTDGKTLKFRAAKLKGFTVVVMVRSLLRSLWWYWCQGQGHVPM